ncbi:hypothetical protein BBD41_17820 [Paenibacillus ihbetae]|uniref:Uncharacterized protein n=1 Tax=Paenibacillus ihbetae TaxID=1870820 RepID=A0A1B2E2R4_9BACL|nr:hypothetical protein [Paenibacillus ihbetae]ANY74280.1 hypothetical protein BBD41_17820 [Paenibacillus ihbetae]
MNYNQGSILQDKEMDSDLDLYPSRQHEESRFLKSQARVVHSEWMLHEASLTEQSIFMVYNRVENQVIQRHSGRKPGPEYIAAREDL